MTTQLIRPAPGQGVGGRGPRAEGGRQARAKLAWLPHWHLLGPRTARHTAGRRLGPTRPSRGPAQGTPQGRPWEPRSRGDGRDLPAHSRVETRLTPHAACTASAPAFPSPTPRPLLRPEAPRPRRPHAPVSRAWPGVWLRPRSGANGPSLPPWPGLVPRRPRRCLSARWLLAAPTPGVCGAAAPSLAHAPHGTTGPRVHLWGPVWPSPMGTPSTSRPRARRRPRLSETAAGDARGSAVWGPRFAGLPWAGGCAPPPAGARPHSRAHGTRPRRWGHGGSRFWLPLRGLGSAVTSSFVCDTGPSQAQRPCACSGRRLPRGPGVTRLPLSPGWGLKQGGPAGAGEPEATPHVQSSNSRNVGETRTPPGRPGQPTSLGSRGWGRTVPVHSALTPRGMLGPQGLLPLPVPLLGDLWGRER